ncbi:isochorismatase family protein [Capnocytophaga sp. G2]|uniref:isochorismatase family protein n=1 Tax=Capnocytophaga sp. G2 TaxID=3110695 RepID=UPI002B493815|nr:isochorismatase family protein [Capnocytophaga sp. G2]MEB3004291.1 isochorismatase family protein [Capnocytophaga sp. G2]
MLSVNDTQLVILDIQGKLSQIVYKSEEILRQSHLLIQGCKLLNIPIIWVEQTPEKLGDTNSIIATSLSELSPIKKYTFSAYRNKDFAERVKANLRPQILLIGIETHICIYQTAYDLVNAGYEVFVVADAVSSRTVENRNIGLQMITQTQGKIISVEGALFSLLKDSQHEKFRDIAKLIK